ncbi:hypothetical protein HELRODRAFT_178325 [Helobdella robusta]|uniref:Uncharacterized protein n=1 Tax=Helobdella robusta TaxID=6412 RepID=T1FD29_HELRO|nr:hypothetical protein HELRODRAFT_178325 [Helobdella robusta]ESN97206.1 hypothetical protein HELRODRAFT_178325 [Helobdella robusta]
MIHSQSGRRYRHLYYINNKQGRLPGKRERDTKKKNEKLVSENNKMPARNTENNDILIFDDAPVMPCNTKSSTYGREDRKFKTLEYDENTNGKRASYFQSFVDVDNDDEENTNPQKQIRSRDYQKS